jgi:hypothetical protein
MFSELPPIVDILGSPAVPGPCVDVDLGAGIGGDRDLAQLGDAVFDDRDLHAVLIEYDRSSLGWASNSASSRGREALSGLRDQATASLDLDVKNQSPELDAFAGQHIGWSGRVFKG